MAKIGIDSLLIPSSLTMLSWRHRLNNSSSWKNSVCVDSSADSKDLNMTTVSAASATMLNALPMSTSPNSPFPTLYTTQQITHTVNVFHRIISSTIQHGIMQSTGWYKFRKTLLPLQLFYTMLVWAEFTDYANGLQTMSRKAKFLVESILWVVGKSGVRRDGAGCGVCVMVVLGKTRLTVH